MSTEYDPEAALAEQLASVGIVETIAPGIDTAPTELRPRAEVVADPRLLELVENRLHPEIVRQYSLPTWAGELPHHLDPVAWRTGFLAVHEGGSPLDIREGLLEQVPQANLRDLFRPEYSEAPVALELMELPLDPGGRRALAEIREARMRREAIPRIEPLTHEVRAIEDERRAFLTTPWKPFLPDDAPRRDVHVLIEPSLSR